MAVAARPGASDARVPCPLCGGLVHPIAGRCKHCKADLTSYHPARPAASAPLPPLQASAPRTLGPGGTNGHAAAAFAATLPAPTPASPTAVAREPVLPPRPASYPVEPRPTAWRSWPAVVIVLAIIAIIAAVVLMAWPTSHGGFELDRKSALPPPPAPERMQTEPDIKQPQAPRAATPQAQAATPQAQAAPDPWASPSPSPRDPSADSTDPAPPSPPAPPDPPDPDPGTDLDPMPNPLGPKHGALVPRPRGSYSPKRRGGSFPMSMVAHVCRKMQACGNTDPDLQTQCASLSDNVPPPTNCPAAARCIAQIDAMACGAKTDLAHEFQLVMTRFHDCSDVVNC